MVVTKELEIKIIYLDSQWYLTPYTTDTYNQKHQQFWWLMYHRNLCKKFWGVRELLEDNSFPLFDTFFFLTKVQSPSKWKNDFLFPITFSKPHYSCLQHPTLSVQFRDLSLTTAKLWKHLYFYLSRAILVSNQLHLLLLQLHSMIIQLLVR